MKIALLLFLLLIMVSGILTAQELLPIRPHNQWASFMGSLKSCSDYLGFGYSSAWINGVTGHAFLLNMHPVVCPSGPVAFEHDFILANAESLGLSFTSINAHKTNPEFKELQKEAFDATQKALADNKPVFGWELNIPEYYLIIGTDDNGYLYYDFDGSVGHKPWDELGESDIGLLTIYIVSSLEREPDRREQVHTALDFFNDYHTNPEQYAYEGYTQGSRGYDVWIEALSEDKADPWGLAYNTQVWRAERINGLNFLEEIKSVLGDKDNYEDLDIAINEYRMVVNKLSEISGFYPFPPQKDKISEADVNQTVPLLRAARDSEIRGIEAVTRFRSHFNRVK